MRPARRNLAAVVVLLALICIVGLAMGAVLMVGGGV